MAHLTLGEELLLPLLLVVVHSNWMGHKSRRASGCPVMGDTGRSGMIIGMANSVAVVDAATALDAVVTMTLDGTFSLGRLFFVSSSTSSLLVSASLVWSTGDMLVFALFFPTTDVVVTGTTTGCAVDNQ